MRISTYKFLLVVATTSVASAAQDCNADATFCTPLFIRDLRRTEPDFTEHWSRSSRYRYYETMPEFLKSMEDNIWRIQRLLDGSLWDLKEWLSAEGYIPGNDDQYLRILNLLIFNPEKIPFKLTEEWKDKVIEFFKPVTKDEEPEPRLVSSVLGAMDYTDNNFPIFTSYLIRFFRNSVYYNIDSGALLAAFSKYLDCLPYSEHPAIGILKNLVSDLRSGLDAMSQTGNFSVSVLEANNPSYQKLSSYVHLICGKDAQQRVKMTLNNLLGSHPRVLEIELRSIMRAVEVVIDIGSKRDPGIAAYIRYFFDKLNNGEIFQRELKETKISSYLKEDWKMTLDIIDAIYQGEFSRTVEDWWWGPKPKVELSHWSKYMEKVLPVPDCFKDEDAPKVKVTDHFLQYQDFFLMRVLCVPIYVRMFL